jgi:hypothetical protein
MYSHFGFGGFPTIRRKKGEWMGHGKALQSGKDLVGSQTACSGRSPGGRCGGECTLLALMRYPET